jgi:amino acid adenylation domain-containing protein
MLRHYQQLLTEVVRDPDRPLSQLPLLPAEERSVLIDGWNDTAAPYPAEPIHAQFERQADATPDACALIFPAAAGAAQDGAQDERLSYRELDRRATRLARHLRASGVRPDTLVGLCLERSCEMLVAQLAILKAGAAYVPLDPSFPVERLKYMVADAGLELVVTRSELVGLFDGLAAPRPVRFARLDEEAAAIDAQDAARFDSGVDAGARMYVIYTSGSTGRPKGVEVEHRSVSNFLASIAREPGFAAGERLLAVTTLSFDIAVLELFVPLVTGGTVILAPKEATADGPALIELCERYRPEVLQATPATWRLLLLSGWRGLAGLRMLSGGEALPRELAEELLPKGRELWNLYGPTETTVWSSAHRVASGEGPVRIGRPIASTRISVLDRARRPAPIGVPGDLWIGGEGLARGYLGRPELTAERFVSDPFSPRPGARMYLTGDRARWHADGTLECLGRIDNQIKLRGYRIELGEIEAVVAEHPSVRQCVAIVREDTPGDQRLTAYCTLDAAAGNGTPSALDADALRALCRARLPGYMVPSAFVALDAFPLTPNAKVDRLALAQRPLETPAGAAEAEQAAPRNELESKIAAVWSRLLRRPRVPIHANFFDLGGHSLLLAEMRVALTEALARPVSVIELFQYPTIAGLAAHLAEARAGAAPKQAEARGRRGQSLSAGRQQLMRRRETRG